MDGNIVCDPITGNKLYDFGMRGTGTVLPGNDTKWRYSRSFLAGGNPTGTLIYDKSEYLYDGAMKLATYEALPDCPVDCCD